jgi:predicted MFS family arabinose efflux permease
VRTAARTRELRLLTVWACLVITGQYALLTFLALDLHRNGGVPLRRAAIVVAVAQLAGVAGRIAWGSVSDRLGAHSRRSPLIVVTGVGLVAALLLAVVPRSSPLAVLAAVAALAGFVLIGYQGLWITMIAEAAGPERVGAATGLAVTFTLASVAASPPLLGLIADLTGTYRSVWIAVVAMLAAAFVPAAALGGRAARDLDTGQKAS